MTKTLLHRHTLATSLFLLSTCNPCAGIKQKSQQDIDGEELLQAIDEDGIKAKDKAIELLNKTPTPNLKIKDNAIGGTSLHYAVIRRHPDIVQLLLAKGANKHLKDKKGQTPLHLAKAMQKKPPNNNARDLQAIIQLLEADNQDTNLFNQKNIFIGIAILIIVAGVGYLFWPEPQDEDTPRRHTKSNAQQKQSTKAARTATAK